MTALAQTQARVVACPDCGTRQRLPDVGARAVVRCVSCSGILERTHGRSVTAALAMSTATLVLLVPANLSLFLRTDALGVSRSSHLGSAAGAMLNDGLPILATIVFCSSSCSRSCASRCSASCWA